MNCKMSRYQIYGFWGILNLFWFKLKTKIYFPNSRLIRFPIEVRGKRFIDFGKQLTTGFNCRLEAYPSDSRSIVLIIGENVQINDYVHITAMKSVIIGDNVLMASKIYISDCTHGSYKGDDSDTLPDEPPISREYSVSPVHIKDNVWIGESVSILPGVVIGKGSIVGANSVVTKSIPDYCIAFGNPARIVKKFDFDKRIWIKVNT